ncbi:hypothetical protein ES703_90611 [subsurface metagenome]
MKIKEILTPLLIILLLLSIVVMGAPTYVNVGPTTDFEGDVGVPSGSGYYINDVLFSTIGLIDISALAKTDGGIIVGDGTNFVLETGITARTSLGLGNVENLKVKLDGTQAPTVNNDVDEGYTVGSRWIDITNDKEYVCLDNTDGAAVWIETTQSGDGAGTYLELTDTPAAYDTGKYAKSTADGVIWDTPAGDGYTNLTEFVDQTAWKLFYSNTDGDVTELALGVDGTYLKSTGASSAPTFDTPSGAGDMLKATYDTDEDGDVDVSAGGTEKSVWTLYAIPYLSGTTTFGEITIGTAEYALTVNAGANGYDWTELAFLADLEDDTDPDLGGQLQAGAHSINFTEQVLTSGTAISWNLGNSNKATLAAAHNFTITITAPSGALNAQLIVTQDGTGSRVMDEVVTQKDEAISTAEVHTDTEIIDLAIDIPTGARIRFKTSAADLPDPLVVDTIYWAIRSSENHIKVATTKANAIAGTAIDLTDTGTGTHTVQQLVKWTGGTLGVLSTAAGAEDILSLTYKTGDKQWYAQLGKDFY